MYDALPVRPDSRGHVWMRYLVLIAGFSTPLVWLNAAAAQSLTVQQPVIETFGVSTVVSVPDRGSILLGSVSGARDSRSWNGFSPLGSSLGIERNHSSVRASVYIHDFAAVDEALRAEAAASPPEAIRPSNPLAANALRQLQRSTPARNNWRQPDLSPAPAIPVASSAAQLHGAPSSAVAASRSTKSAVIPAASRASR